MCGRFTRKSKVVLIIGTISEEYMRKGRITAAIVLVLSCVTQNIYAQTQTQEPVVASPKLNLTLEQRYIIKEIIKGMEVEPATDKVQALGNRVPDNIRLRPIPSDVAQKAPQIKTHRFFVAAKQIVIVNPRDNTVEEIINLGSD
jgi:hypothetical protein